MFFASTESWVQTAPDNLSVYAGLATAGNGTPRVGLRAVYTGPAEAGAHTLESLRRFGVPVIDDIRPRTYLELQRLWPTISTRPT